VLALEPKGYADYNAILQRDCGCAAGSYCAAWCAADPVCPSGVGTPSATCQGCLDTLNVEPAPACLMQTTVDCDADAACKQFLADAQSCP